MIKRGGVDGPGITPPRPSTLALIGFGLVVVGVTVYTLTRPGAAGHVQSAVAASGVVAVTPSGSASPAPVLATTAALHPSESTPATPASTASTPARPAPTTSTPARPAPTTTAAKTILHVALPDGPVTAIVFGDSYVAGVGASSTNDAFPEKAISQLGWKGLYFARAASGYCTSHPVDYLQRLKSLVAGPAPTVFVLEGGINDVGCDPGVLSAQISASITQIKAVYPHAALILLGPAVPTNYPADQLLPVDQALTAAATAAGVPYISPLTENWFTDANRASYMSADGVNPNQAGHAYLTTLLLRDLEQITGT